MKTFSCGDTRAMWLLSICIGGAISCGANAPESERTIASKDAIVGGTATNDYPEMGDIGMTSGCSATLIAPRLVITAGHCQAYGQPVPSGALFRANATGATYPVDFFWDLDQDVGVARLSTPVPSSVATPRKVANRAPNAGELVATFGVGYNDPNCTSGLGTKRYITWHYGDATSFICQGDSGGPSFFWPSSAPAASLWGINSSSPNGITNPRQFLPEIEALSALPGSFETNDPSSLFAQHAALSGVKAVAGDFDNDGDDDVAILGQLAWSTIPLGLSNGAGTFTWQNDSVPSWFATAAASSGVQAIAGDFDGDGFRDDIALVGGPGWTRFRSRIRMAMVRLPRRTGG